MSGPPPKIGDFCLLTALRDDSHAVVFEAVGGRPPRAALDELPLSVEALCDAVGLGEAPHADDGLVPFGESDEESEAAGLRGLFRYLPKSRSVDALYRASALSDMICLRRFHDSDRMLYRSWRFIIACSRFIIRFSRASLFDAHPDRNTTTHRSAKTRKGDFIATGCRDFDNHQRKSPARR